MEEDDWEDDEDGESETDSPSLQEVDFCTLGMFIIGTCLTNISYYRSVVICKVQSLCTGAARIFELLVMYLFENS